MKKIFLALAFCFPTALCAMTYDSGGGAAGADQGEILSGGTANAVVYTNSSKALTTGSAITFDGTNLGLSTTTPTFLLEGWYNWLSEPVRMRQGLRASLQQSLGWPPFLIPNVNRI